MAERVRENAKLNVLAGRYRMKDELLNKARGINPAAADTVTVSDEDFDAALTNISTEPASALPKLKLAFVQNESNIVKFIKHKSSLHTLTGLLNSSDSYEQLLAMECCCNAALGDPKSCFILAKSIGIYVINILEGLNMSLIDAALTTVSNLVADNRPVCQFLYDLGLLRALEKTLSLDDCRECATKALYYFLSSYLHFIKGGDILKLTRLVCLKWDLNQAPSIALVVSVLASNATSCDILIENAIPQKTVETLFLIDSVTRDNVALVTWLVRIIGQLSHECPVLDQNSAIQIVTLALQAQKDGFPHLVKETVWAFATSVRMYAEPSSQLHSQLFELYHALPK